MAANRIVLQLLFDAESAQSQIDLINQKIEGMGTATEKATAKSSKAVTGFSVTMETASTAAENLGRALAGLGIARVIEQLIALGVAMERITFAMSQVPGGTQLIKQIEDVAERTGFLKQQMLEAGNALRVAGVPTKEIARDLESMANQIVAAGKARENIIGLATAITKIQVAAQPTARSLQAIFLESGFSITDKMAEQLNKTLLGMKDTMRTMDPKVFTEMVLAMMAQTNAGLAQKAANETLGGQYNELKIRVEGLSKAMTEALGPSMMKVLGFAQSLLDELISLTREFGKLPQPIKDVTVGLLALAGALTAVGAAWKALQFLGIIEFFTKIGGAIAGAGAAAEGAAGMFTLLEAPLPPTVKIIVGLAAAVAALWAILETKPKHSVKEAVGTAPTGKDIDDMAKNLFVLDPEKVKHAVEESEKVLAEATANRLKGNKEGIAAQVSIYEDYFKKVKEIDAEVTKDRSKMSAAELELQKQLAQASANYRTAVGEQAQAELNKRLEQSKEAVQKLIQEGYKLTREVTIAKAQAMPDETFAGREAVAAVRRDAYIEQTKEEEHLQDLHIEEQLKKDKEGMQALLQLKGENQVKINEKLLQLDAAALLEEVKLHENTEKVIARRGYEYDKESNELQLEMHKQLQEELLKDELSRIQRTAQIDKAYRESQRPATFQDRLKQIRDVSAIEMQAIQDTRDAQIKYNQEYLDKFVADHQYALKSIEELTNKTDRERVRLTVEAERDLQTARLDAWKATDEAILQRQQELFGTMKGFYEGFWDAIMDRSKSVWSALGDFFKKTFMGALRDIASSQFAAALMPVFGFKAPTFPDRMRPGQPYFPSGIPQPIRAAMESPVSAIKFEAIPAQLENTANRFDAGVDVYSDATARFSVAVEKFAGSTVEHQGEADRAMPDSMAEAFSQASQATGVQEPLLRSVAQAESAMHPWAVSPKGAMGLMQLMPSTLKGLGIPYSQAFDPSSNVMGGARYLQGLLQRYRGDVPSALAAYNMGPTAFDRAMARGSALPAETRAYVQKVTGLMGTGGGTPAPPPAPRALAVQYSDGQIEYLTTRQFQPPPPTMPAPQYLPEPPMLGPQGGYPAGLPFPNYPTAGAGFGPPSMALGALKGLKDLRALFGIGTAPGGTTTFGSVLGSQGAANLEMMAGMALLSSGLHRRNAPMTAFGGALQGAGIATMLPALGFAPLGGALLGGGAALFAAGVQRGGVSGLAMDVGGGALAGAMLGLRFGGPLGALIGAGVGAAVGGITGAVRLATGTWNDQLRGRIKQVYGIDISNRGVLDQIGAIIKSKYGGSISLGVYSADVQEIIRLYRLSQGAGTAGLPRSEYPATFAQSQTGGLQLQPVYSGGQLVSSPYSGMTTAQYANLGYIGAHPTSLPPLQLQLDPQQANDLLTGRVVTIVQNNPGVVAQANTNAAVTGYSRTSQSQALLEPLTVTR